MGKSLASLTIDDLPHCQAGFTIKDPVLSAPIWIASSFRTHLPRSNDPSAAMVLSKILQINSPLTERLELVGERYATGELGHGGGVRVGNIGKYQVKGVGPNSLVNTDAPAWYSYGGLTLIDGALECTISCVLNSLRADFCTKIYGLWATSETGAFYCQNVTKQKLATYSLDDYDIGWGGVLLREPVLRPAHFLLSPMFTYKIASKRGLKPEGDRVQSVWNMIDSNYTQEEILEWIITFGEKAADLFAFARSYGIVHGGMTVSNISICGKWLDLNQIWYEPDVLIAQQLHLREFDILRKTIQDLLKTYQFSINIKINRKTILSYIQSVYEGSLARYVEMRTSGTELIIPKNLDDKTLKRFELKNISEPRYSCPDLDAHNSYSRISAIRRLKRLSLVENLKIGEIRMYYEKVLREESLSGLARAVERHIRDIEWVMSDPYGVCRILRTDSNDEIHYCALTDQYVLTRRKTVFQRCSSLGRLINERSIWKGNEYLSMRLIRALESAEVDFGN